jgi:hypothetical protein
MVVRMTVGLVLTVVALAIAGLRLWWLWRLAMSVQPAPERVAAVREHPGRDVAVLAGTSTKPESGNLPPRCGQ